MREIKFRLWNKVLKEYANHEKDVYIVGALIKNALCVGADYHRNEFMTEHFDIEQFTGLLDKNGKEIYEGDIGIAELHNGNRIAKFIGHIEYHTGHSACFVFITKNCQKPVVSFLFKSSFEIIGNVHENPELLKGE